MEDFAALKVKIGVKTNGQADYPNFNTLPSVVSSGLDWSKYVDTYGLGWRYDKTSSHKDDSLDSPRGQQWGMLIVPESFAGEAEAAFPDSCSCLTEDQCEVFYDEKVAKHIEDEEVDYLALDRLSKELELLHKLKGTLHEPSDFNSRKEKVLAKIKRSLDPRDETEGVKTNHNSTWVRFAALKNVKIKKPQ